MSKSSKHLRVLLLMSLFMALSIVFGKFLAFNLGEMLRISFENLPILFAGLTLGPIAGVTVAVGADLLGCLLVGYAINPIITVGAAIIGLLAGLVGNLTHKFPLSLRVIFTVLIAHLIGSVGVKTAGLAAFYGVSYPVLMLWRAPNYLLVGTAEGILLFVLLRSVVGEAIKKILGEHTEAKGEAHDL